MSWLRTQVTKGEIPLDIKDTFVFGSDGFRFTLI